MNLPPPVLISTSKALDHYCEQWLTCRALSIDTEFIRTQTYYPVPALLQVFDGQICYLIDPLHIDNFTSLQAVFDNPDIIKILHSCSEDLEVFTQIPGTLPSPLFDTQLAAAFVGYGFSIGYSRLVNRLFQVELPKEETRSDWLQRPLSEKQVEYACLDVVYLYQLFEHLEALLEKNNKSAWFKEECKTLLEIPDQSRSEEYILSRLKSGWRLSPQEQSYLKKLCLWREEQARTQNKPRNHILKESTLYSLAKQQPQTEKDLLNIEDITHKQRKEFGRTLLDMLHQNNSIEKQENPVFLQPLPREFNSLVKKMKQAINRVSERENLAPEIIARKKDIEALVNTFIFQGRFTLPKSLQGWRKALIGDQLLALCHQELPSCKN